MTDTPDTPVAPVPPEPVAAGPVAEPSAAEPIVLEPLTDELFDSAWETLEQTFGEGVHAADRPIEKGMVTEPHRFLVARDGGRVVGTAGSFGVAITLPGARVPVAGVTWVGVLPTHRRRRLLTRMMTRLLTERYEAGEVVAALWASEAAIYQRFGYGPASWHLSVEVPRGAAFARPVPPGPGLELVAPSAEQLGPVYERVAGVVPGYPARSAAWWAAALHDPEHRREGASPLRCVVTEDGYALYATAQTRTPAGPHGQVRVRELVAATPAAHARLWRYLLDQDLMATVTARLPVDDPLLQLLAEPRSAQARLGDGLWVRPLAVGGALAARRYATAVDTVLAVTDGTCGWNERSWRLSGGPDGAVCEPTGDPAELALDVSDLGAALLGGTGLQARAAAGRVQELRPGALDRVAPAFAAAGGRQPFAPQVF